MNNTRLKRFFEGGRGRGTCIWEPLNTWESFFDKDGKANDYLHTYDEVSAKYLRQ